MLCTKNKPKARIKNITYRVLAIAFLNDKANPTKNRHQILVKNQGSNIPKLTKPISEVKCLVNISKLKNGTTDNIKK